MSTGCEITEFCGEINTSHTTLMHHRIDKNCTTIKRDELNSKLKMIRDVKKLDSNKSAQYSLSMEAPLLIFELFNVKVNFCQFSNYI